MARYASAIVILTTILVVGIGETAVTSPLARGAEIQPAQAVQPGTEAPTVGGSYDYFSARLRTDLGAYLAQVTARHASEKVWALFWAGRYTEPLGDCEYVLTRFPNHPRALHLIGEIAQAQNQVSLAIPYFENALRLYPQYAFTHAQYGHFLIEIGVVPAGIEHLKEALRIEPNQFQAKAWLAKAMAANPELGKESAGGGSSGTRAKPGTGETPKGR